MRNLPCLAVSLALLAAALPTRAGGDARPGALPGALPGKTVALVCRIEGTATLRAAPDAPPEPLALFARLAPGAVLATSPGATVTVVFFDGQRESFGGGSRVVVRRTDLAVEVGQVRRLAPVPAIVDLAPLLRDGSPRWRPAATRLRGNGENALAGLQPHDGARVRKNAVTLSFDVDPAVQVYHVVVEDESSRRVIFEDDLFVPPARVPLRLLRPGTLYHWWVEPKVPPHPDLRGEAMFSTLETREERAREALASAARLSGEPDLAQLLGEVDRNLGLAEPLL